MMCSDELLAMDLLVAAAVTLTIWPLWKEAAELTKWALFCSCLREEAKSLIC